MQETKKRKPARFLLTVVVSVLLSISTLAFICADAIQPGSNKTVKNTGKNSAVNPNPGTGTDTEKDTAAKAAVIDQFMNACYERGLVNGAVLVAERGQVIYRKAFGLAHVEWDVANTPEAKFYLYTLTQQFTAALVLQLVEAGKIKIDGVLKDYLPYYREDTGKKITIHHLLTHTHGIPDLEYPRLPLVNTFTTQQFVEKFLSGEPEFEPGSQFKFSNLAGYTILAAVIEKVTGKPYETVLQEQILNPLQMKNSGYIYDNMILKKLATPYEDTADERRTIFFWSRVNGAASMYATVDDLLLWDRALSGGFLSEKSKQLMFTGYVSSSASGHYGYGWNIVSLTSDNVKKKIAWDLGRSSVVIWRILDDDKVVIILNNALSTKLLEMCIEITNVLYKRPCTVPKKSFVRDLNKIITRQGAAAAVAEYRRLRAQHFNEYNFDEAELTTLGNYLLSVRQLQEAVEIFKLNLEFYPNSWLIYTRLGLTLARGNNIAGAIVCYETAIKLMPRGEEQAYKEISAALEKLKEFQKQEAEEKQNQSKKDTNEQ